jgi:hypothetical protein
MRHGPRQRKFFICFFLSTKAWCLTFMEDTNLNCWGLLVVPVGLTICFGVALLVWLREEISADPEDE